MEFKSKAEENVYNAMKSGKYSIASLKMFENIEKIELSKNIVDHIEYTDALFDEYLYEISEMKEQKPGLEEYLNALKAGDIIDNQCLEMEDSFLIGLYKQISQETAIDKMIEYAKNGIHITSNMYNVIAITLLKGTSTKENEIIRETNEKYVGYIQDREFKISYFPIDFTETAEALNRLSELFNNRLSGETFDNLFIQPFLIHGLFGALQVYGDGNTRLGRLNQHILLWQLINERTKYDFDLPPLYATRSYYPYREEYRSKIKDLVVNGDNEAWNNWFLFNLKRLEDQIYKNNENILTLKRRLKST